MSEKVTDIQSESAEDGTPTKGEANLQGADDQLVGTIIDALVSKVKQCWSVPPGRRCRANACAWCRCAARPLPH